MTEVDTLKARIVELERQSVKALDGLMKANDRLLASTKLQRWGDEKPDDSRCKHFVVYWPNGDLHIGWTIVNKLSPYPLPEDVRWCYVPDAPDWNRIKQ